MKYKKILMKLNNKIKSRFKRFMKKIISKRDMKHLIRS